MFKSLLTSFRFFMSITNFLLSTYSLCVRIITGKLKHRKYPWIDNLVCYFLFCLAGIPFPTMHAEFGPGSGLIFLDNVNCNGTESNLLQCRGNEPGNHDCGHSEDAGVYCPGE